MSRPKGSKNKTTIMRERNNIKNPSKKVIYSSSISQHLKQLEVKRGKPRQETSHVLKINEWLYITCDKHTFILKEVNNEYDKDGKKYPDKCLLYASHLDAMLEVTAHYLSRVPADFGELKKKLDDIKSLISSRIPKNIKPKDLFEEYKEDDCE